MRFLPSECPELTEELFGSQGSMTIADDLKLHVAATIPETESQILISQGLYDPFNNRHFGLVISSSQPPFEHPLNDLLCEMGKN